MKEELKKVCKKMDKHIKSVLIYRIFQIGAFGTTSLLMPITVDEVELGVYFVFLNLVAAQLLFELGLSQALLQVASHVDDLTSAQSNPLLNWLSVVYRKISCRFLFFSITFGAAYLYFFIPSGYQYVIILWAIIAASISVNLAVSYKFTLIESQGLVSHASKGRLVTLLFSSLVTWGLLCLDFGLLSVVIGYLVMSLTAIIWLDKNFCLSCSDYSRFNDENEFVKEIKRIQHKFALSYIGGYLSFNAVIPIIFALNGPVDAGRVGLALALFSSVTILASSFVAAKNQLLAKLISSQDFFDLNITFNKCLALTFFTGVTLIFAVFFGIYALDFFGFEFTKKIIDFNFLIMIALASLANALTYSLAIYVRAHKVEPFVILSCLNALGTLIFVTLGAHFGAGWAATGYSFLSIFWALPFTFIIFLKYYKANSRGPLNC